MKSSFHQKRRHGGRHSNNRNHSHSNSGGGGHSGGGGNRKLAQAQQNYEKNMNLGRDAAQGGDYVAAETYYQHAEFFVRMLNEEGIGLRQFRQPQANGGDPNSPDAMGGDMSMNNGSDPMMYDEGQMQPPQAPAPRAPARQAQANAGELPDFITNP